MPDEPFDLNLFLPYLLNQAAEVTGRAFQPHYRAQHGMTRTQWRVMANLGKFGEMTAADICRTAMVEKSKVSRAVAAMEARGLLQRAAMGSDRRAESLSLTDEGRALFVAIGKDAQSFDAALRARLGARDAATLEDLLNRLRTTPDDGA